MSQYYDPKLSLKVAINKQKSKVIFAEANSDFVDVMFSFLKLPLGKIVRILESHYGKEAPIFGSLTSLYRGLTNLDASHFQAGGVKQMLLNPRTMSETEFQRLKLDITRTFRIEYFVCQDKRCPNYEGRTISVYSDIASCTCGQPLNRAIFSAYNYNDDKGDGVFMIKDSSFIICDDLRIVPVLDRYLQTLDSLGIADADEAEISGLSFGIDGMIKLLELSLTSTTPLTDLIFKDRQNSSTATKVTKHELGFFSNHIDRGVSSSKKTILHLSFQKSSNKFLFAHAKDDFLDLLFSLLTLPLGGVEQLLSGKSSVTTITNLYRSATDSIDHNYFRSSDTKNSLITTKLAYGCPSEMGFLPLGVDNPPQLYFNLLWSKSCYYRNERGYLKPFTWIKGPDRFVKEHKMCIVSDDLTTAPYSIAAVMSLLNVLGIPLSDVRETEWLIGIEEALSILKASLTSTTAITDALVTPVFRKLKKPKQEA